MGLNNCRTKKCSCEDAGLHTLCPNCNPVDCNDPNPCAETFSDQCIIHTGDGLPYYNIETGDSIFAIWQKIILAQGVCGLISVLNLHSTVITSTSIKVAWTIQGTPTSMQLQYSLDGLTGWTANPIVAPPVYTDIIGPSLTPDTYYYLKVVTISGIDTCDSVIIKVKTNLV